MNTISQVNHPYFERVDDPILFLNSEGDILYINPAFEKLSGLLKHAAIGKSIEQLSFGEEFRSIFWSNYDNLQDGETFKDQVIKLNKKGTLSYYQVHLLAIGNEDDEARYFVATIRDVTCTIDKSGQVRFIEEELIKATNTLKQLLYKSSHDLRAPIATIRGLVSLASKCTTDPQLIQYLKLMSANSSKLDALLHDLRKVYTIYLGRFKSEKIDFNGLLNKILTNLERENLLEGVNLTMNIAVIPPYTGYRFIIEKILKNLIDNALRYRSPKADLNGHKHKVEISIENSYTGLKIKIADNGKGIPQDIQDRIFDMFFKGEEGNRRNGMGLFITKTAVAKLNGEIEVESKIEKGTSISINLPE